MWVIFLRTLLIYLFLIVIMRLMGKRQIGELEVTDLVTTLLLSEIASLPITDLSIPISHALLPMAILLGLEVLSSLILIHFPKWKGLVSARPTILIRKGELDQKALLSVRMSMEELMGELRQQGYTDPAQVSDAILEKNGSLTILPRGEFAPPTVGQLGLTPSDDPLMHVVLYNGYVNHTGLRLIGKTPAWLDDQLSQNNYSLKQLFCVLANEDGKITFIPKNNESEPLI